MTALIYTSDSCFYQMPSVKTTAYLDPETCKIEGHHVKYTILNDSRYDLIQYGFTLGAYKNTYSKRVSSKAFTAHRYIPKGSGIEGCLAVPEIKDVNLNDLKKGYYFKFMFFIIVFDLGNNKRWTCR